MRESCDVFSVLRIWRLRTSVHHFSQTDYAVSLSSTTRWARRGSNLFYCLTIMRDYFHCELLVVLALSINLPLAKGRTYQEMLFAAILARTLFLTYFIYGDWQTLRHFLLKIRHFSYRKAGDLCFGFGQKSDKEFKLVRIPYFIICAWQVVVLYQYNDR